MAAMPRIRSVIFAFVLSPLLLATGGPRPLVAGPAQPGDALDLERVIADEMKEAKVPGAAVAVIVDRRVVFAKGFGSVSVETGVAVTPDTLFRLGSTTKMFTGTALAVLAEEGRVALDRPIADYVPGLPPRLGRVTLDQLLSNSGGIADFAAPTPSHDDQALAAMVSTWTDAVLFTDPGRVYSYASPGFWLAGRVLEIITGRAYADAMEAIVFRPLGMTRTTLRPLVALTYPLAVGHDAAPDAGPTVVRPAFDNVAMWPAGSIYSNLTELTRFVGAVLGEGDLARAQGVPRAAIARVTGRHVPIPGEPDAYYGYGLMQFVDDGVQWWMHGGFSRGYGSMIQMAPASGFAVIVLTNRSGQTLPRTVAAATRRYLGRTAAGAPAKHAGTPTAAEMAEVTGTYANGVQRWTIRVHDGQLLIDDGSGEQRLTKTGVDRLSWGDALENDVVLVRDPARRVDIIFTGLYAASRQQSVAP